MVEVEYVRTEEWEGRWRGIFGEAIWDYIMGALVLEFYVVGLIEPPDVVMFHEDVGFPSDGRGFGKFDGGFVVFVDDGG